MTRNHLLRRLGLVVGRVAFSLDVIAGGGDLAATLDEYMTLERVLSREALVAVVAGEGLDRQMDPLVSFQIVIPIEALWALITFERPVIHGRWLVGRVSHKMRHRCCVSAVEAWHHSRVHSDQRELTVRVLNVREDRC